MAVINSTAVGAGTKSAGELTYRHTRGRTIASRRIRENKSNTPAQSMQRSSFTYMAKIMLLFAGYIDAAFEKSKYGSARNSFSSINKSLQGNFDVNKEFVEGQQDALAWFKSVTTDVDDVEMPHFTYLAKGSFPGAQVVAGRAVDSSIITVESLTINFPQQLLSDLSLQLVVVEATGVSVMSLADADRNQLMQPITGATNYASSVVLSSTTLGAIEAINTKNECLIIPVLSLKGKIASISKIVKFTGEGGSPIG